MLNPRYNFKILTWSPSHISQGPEPAANEAELLVLSAGQTILVYFFIIVGSVMSWSLFGCELFFRKFKLRFDVCAHYMEQKVDESPVMAQFVRLIVSPDDLKKFEQKRMANRPY